MKLCFGDVKYVFSLDREALLYYLKVEVFCEVFLGGGGGGWGEEGVEITCC